MRLAHRSVALTAKGFLLGLFMRVASFLKERERTVFYSG